MVQGAQDYGSAAARHLRDAQHLREGAACDNAAYLAGYVAECAVKAVIERAGTAPRVHLPDLPDRLLTLAADLSLAARRYRIDLDADLKALREVWRTDLRYTRTGAIGQELSDRMLEQAGNVFRRTIGTMVLDGWYAQVPR